MVDKKGGFNEIKEDIEEIVKNVLKKAKAENEEYSAEEAPKLAQKVSKDIVSEVAKKNGNFKYAVNTAILNKAEGGLHVGSSCFWNADTDGSVVIKDENDKMHWIVTLYAFAL